MFSDGVDDDNSRDDDGTIFGVQEGINRSCSAVQMSLPRITATWATEEQDDHRMISTVMALFVSGYGRAG